MHAIRVGLVGMALVTTAWAMDHTDSPLVTEFPKTDASDFYLFRSFDPDTPAGPVVLIANFIPLQDPNGGPNYFFMDPEAIYDINVDINGDAQSEWTFRFDFAQTLNTQTVDVFGVTQTLPFLYNLGPITTVGDTNLQVVETFTITAIRGGAFAPLTNVLVNLTLGGTNFFKPLDNVGENLFPSGYESYATQHIFQVQYPGSPPGRVFVGQRREGFLIEPAGVFDGAVIEPEELTGDPEHAHTHFDANLASIVIEIPASYLFNGVGDDGIIGGWCTASLRQNRQLNPSPGSGLNTAYNSGGPYIPVDRVGSPLVNELFIGLPDKNRFNAGPPANDAAFLPFITHPAIGELVRMRGIPGISSGIPLPPRNDLRTLLFQGGALAPFPGAPSNQTAVAGDMLRLNCAVPPTPIGLQHPMGAAMGDFAGFPNGRRPGDQAALVIWRMLLGYNAPLAAVPLASAVGTFPFLASPLPGHPDRMLCVTVESTPSLTSTPFAWDADVRADDVNDRFRVTLPAGPQRFYRFESGSRLRMDIQYEGGELLFKKQ